MNKIITISTLTAGIGVSALGLNANHADAAEYNHNPAPQQHSQFGYHNQSHGQWHPQYNHYQPSGYQQPQFQQQSFSNTQSAANTTSSTSNSSSNDTTSSSSTSSTTTSTSMQTTSSTSGNLYTPGQCTWYVYDKVGGKIGSTWGNANNWASAAQSAGYTVNNTPAKGAILQTTQGSMGHVAYVESVNSDGSITISEMNYTGGPYVVDTRTISSSQVSSFNYIHLS
ncbi:CHAP domain-containing protein [Staphylococcus petrasii]|uniref:CHAP domain-containing protein n=1 Tax=Staphylococcus petrasii TaxID=1276936 RepID=UPI000CD0AA7A|nr:CHAP domain-containing protein [Staphylococcus petrasii]PNZ82170.1 CHAP domain-containing protein [Staphylococcus petrasii]TGA81844.1 CHAP domain-containing protein [Staphylococcus petrasii]SUM59347.1 secretory antigen precursor SsaA [Staphylococcus petrasii]